MPDIDFDREAAWLRRFTADADSNLGAFAQRLKEAMPERVTLQTSRGLFFRTPKITGVSVEIGEHRYILEILGGRLKSSVAMVVRGITLNTKNLEPAEWFRQLLGETRLATEQAKALSHSLSDFMAH